MTRRPLILMSLAVAILLSVSVVTAPVDGEAPAMSVPAFHRTVERAHALNVRIGNGLFRVRIQSLRSRMSVTIEIELPRLRFMSRR
jgi:hypothetical protein